MTTETELQMHHLTQHYNPNATHPAEVALKEILAELQESIINADRLPNVLDGPLISVRLSQAEQDRMHAQLQAQVRTMQGIEKIILEKYPKLKN